MLAKRQSDRFILDRQSSHPKPHFQQQGPDNYDKYLYREMIATQHQSTEDHLIGRIEHNSQNQLTNYYTPRILNPQAEKILDAPDIKDDYYLNLLDWSSKGTLAIGLA